MKSKADTFKNTNTDALNNLPAPVIIFDNNRIYYLNKVGHKILGAKKPCDFYKQKISVFDFLLPEFHKEIKENNVKILNGKPHRRIAFSIKDLTGNILHLESNSNLIEFNGKKAIQTIIQDITDRKNQEAELNDIKEKFNIISNNAHDIIYFFSYTPKPHYLYISPSVKTVLGYDVFNFYKDPFFINKKTIGANNELKKHENQAVAEQRNNTFKQKKVVYQMKGKDGKVIGMEDHMLPIKDEKGRIKFIFGIVRNVTDKEAYAKERLRAELAEEHNKRLVEEIETRNLIEAKLQTVFNTSTHIIWTVNTDYKLTSYNDNYINQLNKYYKEPIKEGVSFSKLYKKILSKKEFDYWMDKYSDAFKGNNILFETEKTLDNGEKIFREIYLNPTKNKKGKVIEVVAISHNITHRKVIEQKALEQSAKLTAIFESSSHLVWTVNKKFELTYFNKNYTKTFEDKYGVSPVVGEIAFNIIPSEFRKENKDLWHELYKRVLLDEQIIFERKDKDQKGNTIYREVFLSPIRNEKGQIFEIACLAHDITENKRYEKENIEQASKIKAIFDGSSHYIWTVDEQFRLTSFNKNYSELIKRTYNAEPEEGMRINEKPFISTDEYNKWWDTQFGRAFKGERLNFQTAFIDAENNKIYLDIYLNPIYHNSKIVEVSGIAHDITERVHQEEKVGQSLKEKEVLLKEVHHRVKNNMQVISSILNLQSSYVTDQYALNLLKESQNRIKTMAYIHESLYQNKTFTSINFSDYVSTLASNILQSYSAAVQKITLSVDTQKIILNLDTSIPAGLIINELVTNSIKHAFTEINEGIIVINLYTKDNVLFLEVSDDGKGFPKEIDFRNTNSLGLQLVNTLVEQLNGKLELKESKNKGTCFFINFPM